MDVVKRGRGRPALSEEEKKRRAIERKEQKKLNSIPKPRGRPSLSEEEKQRRAEERASLGIKSHVGRKPLDPEIRARNAAISRRRYYCKMRDLAKSNLDIDSKIIS